MRMCHALELRGVSKRFVVGTAGCRGSVDALRAIDLRVSPGDALAIVGRAGAGKSTLLLLAAGLLRADSGELSWFGQRDRAVAADRASYYFAGVSPSRRNRMTSTPHIHLIDGPEALGLSTRARIERWIERRRSNGDVVLLTTRAFDVARELVPRTIAMQYGRLRGDAPVVAPAAVAETLDPTSPSW